jgi:hypothetical protein
MFIDENLASIEHDSSTVTRGGVLVDGQEVPLFIHDGPRTIGDCVDIAGNHGTGELRAFEHPAWQRTAVAHGIANLFIGHDEWQMANHVESRTHIALRLFHELVVEYVRL